MSEDMALFERKMSSGFAFDIDGQPRFGIPDLGADEYWAPGLLKNNYLPSVMRGN